MIFITGDTHGVHDYSKLSTWLDKHLHTIISPETTEPVYVIIAGDFGFIWRNPEGKDALKNVVHAKDLRTIDLAFTRAYPSVTFLWIDGNHENFDVINSLPVTEMFGGRVNVITKNVIHLRRGEVYDLNGTKVLTMGGALSVDQKYRKEGLSWWPQEEISNAEVDNAIENLAKHDNTVDIVVSHTAPQPVVTELQRFLPTWSYRDWGVRRDDPSAAQLERLRKLLTAKDWYFGHFHIDKRGIKIPESKIRFHALYDDIVSVHTDTKEETHGN